MEQWVRLAMAIAIIGLISVGLYQFSARAGTVQPAAVSGFFRR
jgi:hypothetical protein